MRLNDHAQRKCGLKVSSEFYAATNTTILAGEVIMEYLGEYCFPTTKSWCAIELKDLVYTRQKTGNPIQHRRRFTKTCGI